MIRNPLVLASAVLVALGAAGALAQNTAPVAEETAKDIVATTVRSQGYSCENPKRAIRDRTASSPDRAAWVVECANATYRVRYDNDLPAEISQID
ncbi:MAG TPA: hypothetical protein VE597_03895 [Geminicoccaceae bacterium]|nr:hypothetical protein [Geminicoccaceae bacterium]